LTTAGSPIAKYSFWLLNLISNNLNTSHRTVFNRQAATRFCQSHFGH